LNPNVSRCGLLWIEIPLNIDYHMLVGIARQNRQFTTRGAFASAANGGDGGIPDYLVLGEIDCGTSARGRRRLVGGVRCQNTLAD
jgi:hypothetical protein